VDNGILKRGSAFSWWFEATPYQQSVLIVALLGWVFDSMNASIYSIVQTPALTELLGADATKGQVSFYGGIIFSIFIIGWAIGGILFGILADYFGRARVMTITILIYAIFTGMGAFAHNWWELALYRFLSGLGIGGEWAAGATLVAEVWPDRHRARAASVMQSAWAIGFFLAAFINLCLNNMGWRMIFFMGILPALLALFIRFKVQEPECWQDIKEKRSVALADKAQQDLRLARFTLSQLFEPWIRRDTIVGTLLTTVAAFGLWGATNWTPSIVRDLLAREAMPDFSISDMVSFAVMSLNAGAFIGYLTFAPLADRFGRRPAFFFMMLGSALMLPATFLLARDFTMMIILLPLLGFFNNGIFSGFPIYFPELFPTHMRTTGAGFCFNAGRIFSAAGPFITGALVAQMGYNRAASSIAFIYILGMITLIFARETKGRSLAAYDHTIPLPLPPIELQNSTITR
jgi:MFS family permease